MQMAKQGHMIQYLTALFNQKRMLHMPWQQNISVLSLHPALPKT